MTLFVALVGVGVTMSLALGRAILGPTSFDRILGLNMFGTKTVVFIGIVGLFTGRTDFVDLALLYALLNFIGVIAVLRFSRYASFADTPGTRNEDGG